MSFSVVSLLHCSPAESAARAQELAASLAGHLPQAHAERSRLHALQACALHSIDLASARVAAQAARTEAQNAGREVSIAWALLAEIVAPSLEPSQGRRLENCREALHIALKSGERGLISGTYFLLLAELAESGSLAELDRALNPSGALQSAAPWLEHEEATAWFRCFRTILDGQVSRAAVMVSELQNVAPQTVTGRKQTHLSAQLAVIRWMQGRTNELESLVLTCRRNLPNEAVWSVLLAWVWAQQGRRIAAGALLETLPPVDELPQDRNLLATLCLLILTRVELGDRDAAAALRAALFPFRERLISLGFGAICLGTVHRPIARVSELLSETEEAIHHYRAAVSFTARLGAHPWLAETQLDLAKLLMQCGDPARVKEAEDLAAEALATAHALQLPRIEALAASLLASIRKQRELAVLHASLPEPGVSPTIRVLGTFEVNSIRGEPVRWQSKKARELLKILISRRGAAITRERAIDMLWPGEPIDRLYNRLAVAASTIRRALDPEALFPPYTFIESGGEMLRLHARLIEIDAERFMSDVRTALECTPDSAERISLLTTALDGFAGDAFMDEPDATWADDYRRELHDTFLKAAHALALAAHEQGDHFTRVDAYRRILKLDRYEQRAHEGLIHALRSLGAHGQASAAEADYAQCMAELGLEVEHSDFPFAGAQQRS